MTTGTTTRNILLLCVAQAVAWAGNTVTTQSAEILPASRSAATPARMVFPYVYTGSGFDTEITISRPFAHRRTPVAPR